MNVFRGAALRSKLASHGTTPDREFQLGSTQAHMPQGPPASGSRGALHNDSNPMGAKFRMCHTRWIQGIATPAKYVCASLYVHIGVYMCPESETPTGTCRNRDNWRGDRFCLSVCWSVRLLVGVGVCRCLCVCACVCVCASVCRSQFVHLSCDSLCGTRWLSLSICVFLELPVFVWDSILRPWDAKSGILTARPNRLRSHRASSG